MSRTRAAALAASSSISEMARAIARTSPARTRSASEDAVTSGGQQLSRDHETLDLAGAFADRQQFDVAKVFLGWIVLHEAVTTVHLHAVFGRADRDLTGIELGHGRVERHAAPLILQPGGLVGQQTRRLHPRGMFRQTLLNRRERGDRAPELRAL